MMNDTWTVECHRHGPQQKAFVCEHIASSLRTGVPVGFHWSGKDQGPHPDAWCSLCEDARLGAGGDWTPEVEKMLGVTLLCGLCYETAKEIGMLGQATGTH
jgi:hypothetical protein